MKKAVPFFLILIVFFFALSLAKNGIAQMALAGGVRAITGLKLNIQGMDVGLLQTSIRIRGLEILNPHGFSDRVMADLPEVYVNYDLRSFLKGRVHLEEVRLHLKELTVVKNEKGELNLHSLKTVREKKEAEDVSAEKEKASQIQIDRLQLQVGKVIYKDYSGSGSPRINEFQVNIHEQYENISNPYVLATLIVHRALLKTTVARLANFDMELLEGELHEVVRKYRGLLTSTAGTTKEAGTQVVGAAKQAAEETKEVLKRIFQLE